MKTVLRINSFSTVTCKLGEGPLWHPDRKSLFWLDITNKILYEKHLYSQNPEYDNRWDLPLISSALAVHGKTDHRLWMLTEQSFGEFDLLTAVYSPRVSLPVPVGYRTNDGGVAPDGSFWFGTMQKKPKYSKGQVFSIQQDSSLTHQLDNIGIPNTFCWIDDGQRLLLTDSLSQQMVCYEVIQGQLNQANKTTFIDLHGTSATPDGGAMDYVGNIWNAQWDGHRVICYNNSGHVLQSIEVPVPKPSSCCFGGPEYRHLFITSASEDMDEDALKRYPKSGNVFVVELDIKGQEIKSFNMEC